MFRATESLTTVFKYLINAPRGAKTLISLLAKGSDTRSIWLTFDDGPHVEHTPTVLRALENHSVCATFFVVGQRAQEQPHLVEQIFAAGHRIGNHTYSHPYLTRMPKAEVSAEILATERIIGKYIGDEKVFRPPYGACNDEVNAIAADLGYRTVLWNVSTHDWNQRYQPHRWIRRGTRLVRFRQESRILLHDPIEGTALGLGRFLTELKGRKDVKFMPPETL